LRRDEFHFAGRDGFTLIELVVVIAILAILSGILIPVVSSEIDNSRRSRGLTDMKTVANAFASYRTHTGYWPHDNNVAPVNIETATVDLDDYRCLFANVHSVPNWKGPYMNVGFRENNVMQIAGASAEEGLYDPWGHLYKIRYVAVNNANAPQGAIIVASVGPNNVLDTSDVNLVNGFPTGDDLVYVVTRRL
jgi:general secretion pathway protein G